MSELGMDPEKVLAIAKRLDSAAHRVEAVGGTVDRVMASMPGVWLGRDAQGVAADWTARRASLRSASAALQELASKARSNAHEQMRTSREYGSVGGGSGESAQDLLKDIDKIFDGWGDDHDSGGGCLSSSLTHVGHFFEGAGEALWDAGKGIVTLGWDLTGAGGWDKFKQAWGGLGTLAILATPGLGVAVYGPKGYTDRVTAIGKSFIDFDEWSKDPAKAAGYTFANIATLAVPGGGEVDAVADGARAAELAEHAGQGADVAEHAGAVSHAGEAGADAGHAGDAGHGVDVAHGGHDPQFSDPQVRQLPSSAPHLDQAIASNHLTLDSTRGLINSGTHDPAQLASLSDLRHSVPPLEPGEPVQKALAASDGDSLIDHTHPYPTSAAGYVARLGDTDGILSPAAQHDAFALGYENSKFSPDADYSYSLRFRPEGDGVPSVPLSPEFGGTVTDPRPFTGNGFTASGERIMPEFKYSSPVPLQQGAELWRLLPDGREELAGVLNRQGGWDRVG